MRSEFTIGDIERAINILRARHPSGDEAALCAPARALAEPYTLLFMGRRDRIASSSLTPVQLAALTDALGVDAMG